MATFRLRKSTGGSTLRGGDTLRSGGTSTQALTGTLFTDTATFYAGTLTWDQPLTGTLFTNTAVFYTGTLTGGGVQALTGTLFTDTAVFYAGTVSPGTVALTGTLFTDTATFYVGTVSVAGVSALYGTLYTNTPTFGTGLVTGGDITYISNTPNRGRFWRYTVDNSRTLWMPHGRQLSKRGIRDTCQRISGTITFPVGFDPMDFLATVDLVGTESEVYTRVNAYADASGYPVVTLR